MSTQIAVNYESDPTLARIRALGTQEVASARAEAEALLGSYLPYLRVGGRVLFVCPQERGYASDPTHVRFADGADLERLATRCGLRPDPWFSFPFPRWTGKLFIYNEFCVRATKAS